MTRTLLAAMVASVLLGACAASPDSFIAERADNDMLRFSASNYATPALGPR
ncbi:hypothetical protein [Yoonia sp. 208BN28-4]|uniref:hypothetical protein n=1 Tax=Yoonia sp. 208BN28-4 TaxID=3126505 RepID=UPI00309AEFBB